VVYSLQGFKAELFKALAHPARIKMVEHLRSGERTVSELQALLDVESSTVSQQLAILRARSIVEGRKQGSSVYYRVSDPMIFDLLDVARQIFVNYVGDLQAMATADRGAPTRPAASDSQLLGDPGSAAPHGPADQTAAAPHTFAERGASIPRPRVDQTTGSLHALLDRDEAEGE
jgi:DNA-binding transcriptional ArsR family regulator